MKRIAIALTFLLALASTVTAQEGRPGLAVDAKGGQVIDPTKNVLDLVEASIRRQDDLRNAAKELFDSKLSAMSELNFLRSKYEDQLLKAAVDRLDDQAKLRAEFATAIAATEKARVDAIRGHRKAKVPRPGNGHGAARGARLEGVAVRLVRHERGAW